jgi:hypothetical protein
MARRPIIGLVERISLLRVVRVGCRRAVFAGLLVLASSAAGRAAQGNAAAGATAGSCAPFCGVLRFMGPQPHVAVQHAQHAAPVRRSYAARRGTVRVAQAVTVQRPYPRRFFAAAGQAVLPYGGRLPYPGTAYPHYGGWPPPYSVYVYPGYGYVYYYAYPYGYAGY